MRIPVGTVLWEEIAFRGVLQAALRRVMDNNAAIAVTSGVFGIWHLRPTLQALRANGLADSRRHVIAGVCAGVAATTAGGAFLSWLRERSGGLAAPIMLHLVTNSGGVVAAWAVAAPHRPRLPRNAQAGYRQRHGKRTRCGGRSDQDRLGCLGSAGRTC
jgi:uncharacterized protein